MKEGQDALGRKMDKHSSQGETQMKFMTDMLTYFNNTMMGTTGAYQHAQSSLHHQMVTPSMFDGVTFVGTQPVPLEGLAN